MSEIVFTILGVLIAVEFSSYMVIGLPCISMDREYLRKQISEAVPLCVHRRSLETSDGFISTMGLGLTGTLYFCNTRTMEQTRIPWWTDIYCDVEQKRAELGI